MPCEKELYVTIRVSAHNLEDLYTCIRLLAKNLCSEMECLYPETLSWIIAGDENCLVKVMTPQPLHPVSGSNLLPAIVASSIEITCSTPRELISKGKTIFNTVKDCKGIGTTLS